MTGQILAILWAQWRTIRSRLFGRGGGHGGTILSIAVGALWYGLWTFAAYAVFLVLRETEDFPLLYRFLSPALILAFFYWQVVPVLMASAGVSLELRRLRVYPVPHSSLFSIEVLLRITAAIEIFLVCAGAAFGIVANPNMPNWWAAAFLPFILFNLFLSAGVREILTRLFSGKRFREIGVLFIVLLAGVPQLVLLLGLPDDVKRFWAALPDLPFPWTFTAQMATGTWSFPNVLGMAAWIAAAWGFGRWQFERSLNFDAEEARSSAAPARDPAATSLLERLYRFPSRLLPDPMGAILEKEIRSLARSPRFRMILFIGITLGPMIWIPMASREGRPFLREHVLVMIFAYALLLISEILVWNVLGFDRSAAQIYWLAPISPIQMLVAKNIASFVFLLLEIAGITCICLAFRLPITFGRLLDGLLVCLILLVALQSLGNLSSLRFPRPVDPNQTWRRASAVRIQAILVVIYPLLGLPFLFAFYARTAWESEAVFYGLLALLAVAAFIAYGFSLEKAAAMAASRREDILATLARDTGPMAS